MTLVARELDGHYSDVLPFPDGHGIDRDVLLAQERALDERLGHRPGA